ncbi:MAG: polysaccharide export protein [Proteobacteria bacterium]|nr:polysaccharide export protein [Pseudomonadota bacterium]
MERFILSLALLASLTACRDDPPTNYPTAITIDESTLPLGPGDKLNLVVFYGSKTISATYVLDSQGAISVQYIGTVKAGGRTASTVRQEIQERLGDGYLQNPLVQLDVVELNSLTLSVSGMVGKTGNIRFKPGLTITDAIALSGGFTPLARKNMVKVTRVTQGAPQTYKLPVERIQEGERPNFPMLPGDDVFVPERPW